MPSPALARTHTQVLAAPLPCLPAARLSHLQQAAAQRVKQRTTPPANSAAAAAAAKARVNPPVTAAAGGSNPGTGGSNAGSGLATAKLLRLEDSEMPARSLAAREHKKRILAMYNEMVLKVAAVQNLTLQVCGEVREGVRRLEEV